MKKDGGGFGGDKIIITFWQGGTAKPQEVEIKDSKDSHIILNPDSPQKRKDLIKLIAEVIEMKEKRK